MARTRRTYTRRPRLWKRGRTWYIVWQDDQQTRKLSTKTGKRAFAEAALDRFLEDFDEARGPRSPITLHEGIRAWLEDKKRPRQGLSPMTLSHYGTWSNLFLENFPKALLARDVTPAMIRKYLDAREDQGISPSSLRKDLGGLSMIFRFLEREGLVRGNPCGAVRVRATPKRHPAMTEDEFTALREAMALEVTEAETQALRRAAQELLDFADVIWHSGLRSIEATRLIWEDIDFDQGLWTIRSPANKGGTATLPIHADVIPILSRRRLLGMPGPFRNAHWLSTTWRRFKERHTEFKGWSWHRMRHAMVTRLRRLGLDAAARALARHHSEAMLQHYTQLELGDLRKALGAL